MADTYRLWQWYTFWHSLLTEQFISSPFSYVIQIVPGSDKCPVVFHFLRVPIVCCPFSSCAQGVWRHLFLSVAIFIFVCLCPIFISVAYVQMWDLLMKVKPNKPRTSERNQDHNIPWALANGTRPQPPAVFTAHVFLPHGHFFKNLCLHTFMVKKYKLMARLHHVLVFLH